MSAKGQETNLLELEQATTVQPERRVVVSSVGGITSTAAERRRELERLLTDPTFFRMLADTMPDVGLVVDLEGNFVYVSAAAEYLTGYSADQLRRMNMADVVSPEVLSVLQDRIQRRIRGEELPEIEFEVVARDGSRHMVEMRTSPIVDQDGNLLGIQAIVRDMTARRRAEGESARRAEYLRALAELSMLLLEPREAVPVPEALGILGRAAHVQRVTLFDHVKDEEGQVVAVQRAYWLLDPEGCHAKRPVRCVYGEGELEAFAAATAETGAFSGPPEIILKKERISEQCPQVGSVAVITLGQPLDKHGFAVFEHSDRRRVWSDWELDFLRTGVHMIAQALVRARMRRDERLLAEFGEAVAAVGSREKLAEILSGFTRRHFSWDAFVLALRSIAPGQPDFLYMVDTAEDGNQIQEQRDSWSAESLGPRAKHILAGHPLLINRKQTETAKSLEAFGYTQRKSASLVFVPIVGRDRVEGMISIQSYTPFAYREEDLRCLESLAGLAGLVLGRLRTQAELHGAEERFRNIADMVDAYIWSADVEGTYPDWRFNYRLYTSGVERVTGVPADDFLREGASLWLQMVHPEDRAILQESLRRLARGNRAAATYRIRRPDGQERWVRDSVVPTLDTQGRVIRLDGLCLDVTEEQKVAQERDRLFQAVDRSGEAIVLLSPGGAVEYVNRAFSVLTGIPREEAKGKLWYKLGLFDRELEKQRRQILRDLRTRGFWTGRTALRTGEKRLPIEMTTSAVKDSDGRVRHWVVTIRDISERVALEEQLRQSQKLEALGTLAAGIAHD
ncbi:MAG: PAS domain S-box protein, partial [Calditrichaeota bacterium]|nr:PAS domain S-box protein [Calditrichota bacterium]